jgi:hypothetical protein
MISQFSTATDPWRFDYGGSRLVRAVGQPRLSVRIGNCDRDLRYTMIETLLSKLEQRLGGRLYAKQRLGIETDHQARIFGQGLTFFHIENWYSIH